MNKKVEICAMNWIPLTSVDQLNEISASDGRFLIFKHSTRCGISAMVLRRFQKEWKDEAPVDVYLLDLIKYRDISSEIAMQYDVRHESPQLLLVQDGELLHHASHHEISATTVLGEK